MDIISSIIDCIRRFFMFIMQVDQAEETVTCAYEGYEEEHIVKEHKDGDVGYNIYGEPCGMWHVCSTCGAKEIHGNDSRGWEGRTCAGCVSGETQKQDELDTLALSDEKSWDWDGDVAYDPDDLWDL